MERVILCRSKQPHSILLLSFFKLFCVRKYLHAFGVYLKLWLLLVLTKALKKNKLYFEMQYLIEFYFVL